MTRPTKERIQEIRAHYEKQDYGPVQDVYDLLAEVTALEVDRKRVSALLDIYVAHRLLIELGLSKKTDAWRNEDLLNWIALVHAITGYVPVTTAEDALK